MIWPNLCSVHTIIVLSAQVRLFGKTPVYGTCICKLCVCFKEIN